MINRTRFEPLHLAGFDMQLPLVLAGARALTRFGRACVSQRQLASASESVIDLSTASLHQIGNIPSPLVDLPQWTVSYRGSFRCPDWD
jgi:hypothetical protein